MLAHSSEPAIAGSFSVDSLPDPIQALGHRVVVLEGSINPW